MALGTSDVAAFLRWLIAASILVCVKLAAGLEDASHDNFCACLSRDDLFFSFLMHHRETTTTVGAELVSGARQAAQDRAVKLNEHVPLSLFRVEEAMTFIDAEVHAGSSGIITTFYNHLLLPSFNKANAAGIPVYLVGGADPELVQSLRDIAKEPVTGPVRASVRYIGPDERRLVRSLAEYLISIGITHLECVTTDIGDWLMRERCKVLSQVFVGRNLTADWHLRAGVVFDLLLYVEEVEQAHRDTPAPKIAVIVMDSTIYRGIKQGFIASTTMKDVWIVCYETSTEVLQDVKEGSHVLAADPGFYTQGYLALAMAYAERATGQAVTSDVMVDTTFFGGTLTKVTDEVLARENCRSERHPVCGDPNVDPVSKNGCPCFNRSSIQVRTIGSVDKSLPQAYTLWRGVMDAQRDLPGTSFQWNYQDSPAVTTLADEYLSAASSNESLAIVSLDTLALSPQSSLLKILHNNVSAAGKPLYLAYARGGAGGADSLLNSTGARWFVGGNLAVSGSYVGDFATRQKAGYKHVLVDNPWPELSSSWEFVQGLFRGVLGEGYVYPAGMWDGPFVGNGNASERTGLWQLWVALDNNATIQVMNGPSPASPDFTDAVRERLARDLPAPDVLAMQLANAAMGPELLLMLKNLSDAQPGRPSVPLVSHLCSVSEFEALWTYNSSASGAGSGAGQGNATTQGTGTSVGNGAVANNSTSASTVTSGSSLLAGCVDEQTYLSTYLAMTAAALEQQTGERVVGEVRSDRLLQRRALPPRFARRVQCELASFYGQKESQASPNAYFPVCDVRKACVDPGAAANASVCSGHGVCTFPQTRAEATERANGTGDLYVGRCACSEGYQGAYCSDSPHGSDSHEKGNKILLAVLLSIGLALLATAVALFVFRRQLNDDAMQALLRKRKPPQKDYPMVAIITDIESSTSLWEWNPVVMRKALAIHHNLLRSLLPKYHGYESDTEGDSFTLVFHDAADALGWAMDVQRNLLFPLSVFSQPLLMASSKQKGRHPSGEDAHDDWPPELLTFGTGTEVKDFDGNVLYRGLRVRMGVHMGVPDSCVMHANGRQHYQGEVMEVAKAIEDSAASGGQVLVSLDTWQAMGKPPPGIVCMHMGLQELGEKLPPMHILQVMPEELVKRSPYLPIKSKKLGPSFFDAPAADSFNQLQPPTEPLVIAFIYVGGAKLLRKAPVYKESIDLLVKFIQSRLAGFEAYECDQREGNFMLAFKSPVQAVRFAEAVQREAMYLDWSEALLELEMAAEVAKPTYDMDGTPKPDVVVFRGIRLQIGLCMGVANECRPDKVSGRASYTGPVVHRAAKIAATAAWGQTLANDLLFHTTKETATEIIFQEVGKFDLRGLKDQMELYQLSSPILSARLFPRKLKLAKALLPMTDIDLTALDDERRTTLDSSTTTRRTSEDHGHRVGFRRLSTDGLNGSSLSGIALSGLSVAANESPLGSPFARKSRERKVSVSGRKFAIAEMGASEVDDEPDFADMTYNDLLALVKRQRAEYKALTKALGGGKGGGI